MSLIDPKKIVVDGNYGTYAVNYIVFVDDDKKPASTPDEIEARCEYKSSGTRACFAGLRDLIGVFKSARPTHIMFTLNYKWCGNPKFYLSVEMRQWWIDICQKHGIMPKEIGKDVAETGYYKIYIADSDMNQIYLYLWSGRLMHEEPYYVTNMHYLTKDIGLDFFVALGVASQYCIRGTGHNIMDTVRQYGGVKAINKFDISQAMAIPCFLREYKPKETVTTANDLATMGGFRMQSALRRYAKTEHRNVAEEKLMELKAE